MKSEHTNYYSRTDELSSRAYNIVIGVVLLWGFVINALMCKFCTDFFFSFTPITVIISYFVIALARNFIGKLGSSPFISFIVYNFVVIPFGMLLSIFLKNYETVSILITCSIIIAIVTLLIMVIVSSIFPYIFLSIKKTLFKCLTVIIIVEIICAILRIYIPLILYILLSLPFCFYIGYDWIDTQTKTKNIDNAVNTCVKLYLDIIVWFVFIMILN